MTPDGSVARPGDDEWLACTCDRQVVTDGRNLFLTADAQPFGSEHGIHFKAVELSIGIHLWRQANGSLERSARLAESFQRHSKW